MDKSLQVIEQKTVSFYDDELIAVRTKDGSVYVPVRPLTDLLGLNWSGQRQRIMRDAVLSEKVQPCVVVTHSQGQPDQRREVLCLPLDYISGFLFGINANRVKDDVRQRLLLYQEKCYQVLSEAFFEGQLNPDTSFDMLLQNTDNPAVQAYHTFQALAKLARHQLILESRITDNTERIEQLESIVGDTKHHITPAQASEISQAVQAVAMELQKLSGRNEYGGVYGELYRRFEITSYKQLPKNRFEEARVFLNGWYGQITGGDDVPF